MQGLGHPAQGRGQVGGLPLPPLVQAPARGGLAGGLVPVEGQPRSREVDVGALHDVLLLLRGRESGRGLNTMLGEGGGVAQQMLSRGIIMGG